MCGIAGAAGRGPAGQLEAAVAAMTRAQAHRGPDDDGLLTLPTGHDDAVVVLGSRRLAILDLSPAGHQPMSNEAGTVWVVYNGEIYNFPELRRDLVARGHRFRSNADTEVVVHLYEDHGEDCFARLRGMYAVAVWDRRDARLVLARDRFGEKPLYYSWDGARFVFASEVKALLASGLVERRLDGPAVRAYLALGSLPAPLSIVEGILALPPASVLTFRGGRITTRRYWSLRFEEDPRLDANCVLEELRERLRDAVRVRLLSDVPLGAFLSGGMDSSTVVAFMREAQDTEVRTFALGFEQAELNEADYARRVAHHFGTKHTEHVVTAADVLAEVDAIVAAMDQPSIDGLNTYFVSRLTRSSGTVVALSGLGGDELFGGYSPFWWIPRLCRLGQAVDTVPGARTALGRALRWVPAQVRRDKLAAFLRGPSTPEGAYVAIRGLFLNGALDRLLARDFAASADPFDPVAHLDALGMGHAEALGNRISGLELGAYMHNQLLRDADVMSMAHSLEVRAPLLDHHLAEFVARVPAAVKFAGRPKHLLARAMEPLLPREVVDRPKRGFAFPLAHWLHREWRDIAGGFLGRPEAGVGGVFAPDGLRALWQAFGEARVSWAHVWSVIVLQLWIAHHLDGRPLGFRDGARAVRSH